MIITYRRNREQIQAIAQRKYRHRWLEPGGDLIVRLEDVDAQSLTVSAV